LKRRIAFFDFDGTITTKDTLLEMIKYQKGTTPFFLGFLLNGPLLVAFKLKIVSNHFAKERILKYFFGGTKLNQFQEKCDDFALTILPNLVRKKALSEIQRLQAAGADVVIVSASAENWVLPWCRAVKVGLIATRLQAKGDVITGAIEGRNCHGEEKVRRIEQSYKLDNYDEIYCYGDTKGDKPMLELATFKFYCPFR
jgi:phosphatidylglycerophosphatase C